MFTGLVMVLASCASKVFFNEDARQKLEKAKVGLDELQFYNDKEMLLRRKTTSRQLVAEGGVVNKSEGLRVQDLRIRRGTACRVDSVGAGVIYIRFELGEGQVMKFYKNQFGYYQVWADRWVAGRGNIIYGGKDYLVERVGNDCLLMVKNTQKFRDVNQKKTAKGVLVGEDLPERDTVPLDIPEDSLRKPQMP